MDWLLYVYLELPLTDIRSCMSVNKEFYRVGQNNVLWKERLIKQARQFLLNATIL
jgi:hypothetical protein